MPTPRTYKTEGVVIRQIPLGEADRILTLYTPDMGKIRAVAKGVRRTKSKLGGHLELLTRVVVSASVGRNLDIVNEAQVIQSFRALREELSSLTKALYLAELVDAFSVEHSANDSVYRLLLAALDQLEATEQADLLLRHFELHLLDYSGYRPELYSCVECRSDLEAGDHLFSCAKGGVVCPRCLHTSRDAMIPISLNAMKVARFLIREEGFARVAGLQVSQRALGELERLLRTYVRHVVERGLKTAEFMSLVSSAGVTPTSGDGERSR